MASRALWYLTPARCQPLGSVPKFLPVLVASRKASARCSRIHVPSAVDTLGLRVVNVLCFPFEDDDDEVGDDEDEDDGFFVPHGYLSEDEGVTEVRGRAGR